MQNIWAPTDFRDDLLVVDLGGPVLPRTLGGGCGRRCAGGAHRRRSCSHAEQQHQRPPHFWNCEDEIVRRGLFMRGASHGHFGDASGGDRVARLSFNSPFQFWPADPHRDTLRQAAVPSTKQSLFRQKREMKCSLKMLLVLMVSFGAAHAVLANHDQVADSTDIANQIGEDRVS